MKTKIRPIYLVPILAVIFVLIYASINSLVSKGSDTLHVYSSDEMGEQVPFLIEDFSLLDQNGDVFTRADIDNRIVISNFFFASCPKICPTINGNIKEITRNFSAADDVLFLSHTVDPYNDTISVLRDYADKLSVSDDQWRFLTGKKSTIYHLAIDNYKAVIQEVPDTSDFIHSEKVMLVDREFHIRGIYNGLDKSELNQLTKDAQRLLATYKEDEKN
ncbi:SCO family protein [Bacteroidia bacterium]|jgi:protein SCO1/2|nr:SCO family protein [Bacteroidia bacterium]